MTDLSKHAILRAIYEASQAIEKCGASEALTAAVMATTALYTPAEELIARAESAEQRERDLREILAELLAADYAIRGDIVSDDYHAMALRWSRAKDAARAALAPAQQEGGE